MSAENEEFEMVSLTNKASHSFRAHLSNGSGGQNETHPSSRQEKSVGEKDKVSEQTLAFALKSSIVSEPT